MCDKAFLENDGTLESVPGGYKYQQRWHKTVDNYPHWNCPWLQYSSKIVWWSCQYLRLYSTLCSWLLKDSWNVKDKGVYRCFLGFIYISD